MEDGAYKQQLVFRYAMSEVSLFRDSLPHIVRGCDKPMAHELSPGELHLACAANPSSAKRILQTGFSLNHSGKSTGTLLGYG